MGLHLHGPALLGESEDELAASFDASGDRQHAISGASPTPLSRLLRDMIWRTGLRQALAYCAAHSTEHAPADKAASGQQLFLLLRCTAGLVSEFLCTHEPASCWPASRKPHGAFLQEVLANQLVLTCASRPRERGKGDKQQRGLPARGERT